MDQPAPVDALESLPDLLPPPVDLILEDKDEPLVDPLSLADGSAEGGAQAPKSGSVDTYRFAYDSMGRRYAIDDDGARLHVTSNRPPGIPPKKWET